MNAFHANAPAKIESKRGKSCGATRDARRLERGARWCEDNWVNTFGPAVCRWRRYIPRPGPVLLHYARAYVRDIHAGRRHNPRTYFVRGKRAPHWRYDRVSDSWFKKENDGKRRCPLRGPRANTSLIALDHCLAPASVHFANGR